mmetsp:Transcript_74652/g.242599  ORF Transcript_74652/g.242599 Transcript_74652/m.242599 type:complete len:93 (-) Transcript_74652:96-374(-)
MISCRVAPSSSAGWVALSSTCWHLQENSFVRQGGDRRLAHCCLGRFCQTAQWHPIQRPRFVVRTLLKLAVIGLCAAVLCRTIRGILSSIDRA